MRYRAAVILVAAAGAALAPSHVTNRRAVTLRALTADALETKRLQCFSAFDDGDELTVAVAQWLQMRALRPNTSGRPFQGTIEEALELIIVGEPQYIEPLGEPQ